MEPGDDDYAPYCCTECGWSGDLGDTVMTEDSDGDATGFHCPECGGMCEPQDQA